MEYVGKVVVAAGGVGAIIVAISSYIAKIWANSFIEKEKEKHSKEIEAYKKELQKELEEIKMLNEEISYKKRFIFDSEYKYFEEIVPKLIKAGDAVRICLVNREEYSKDITNEVLKNLVKEEYNIASKANFEFYDYLCKYAVFIDNECYTKMLDYMNLCLKMLEAGKDETKIITVHDWDLLLEQNLKAESAVIDFLRKKIRG
jgi:hypothetical protein